MVTRGLEAPNEINIFSRSVQWFFQPTQCFVNIDSWKMATKIHEDGVQTHTFNGICRGFCTPSSPIFLTTISFSPFFFPWPTAGTSSCRRCSFAIYIDMLGWTTMGWAGHRHVSLHGHTWSLCTMFTAYRFSAFQQIDSVLNSCTTKSAQQINTYVTSCTWTVRSIAAKLSTDVPEECTAYQQTRMSLQFMKDESSGAYYQERYHGQPPTPPRHPQRNRHKQQAA